MTGYHSTAAWQRLRKAVLDRDNWTCTTPGCGLPALIADHIISRRNGGLDDLANLRSLCRGCDHSIKEDASGRRRGGGKARARGCRPDGTPRDVDHWWASPRKSLRAEGIDRMGYSEQSLFRRGGRPPWA